MIVATVIFAATCLMAGLVTARHSRLWLGLTLLATSALLLTGGRVLFTDATWEWRSDFRIGGELAHMRLDAISGFFLALLSVVGGGAAIYSRDYWSDRDYPDSAPTARRWWSAMLLSMGLVLVCSNGLHFLLAWELFAVSGYFLMTVQRQSRTVRTAGWLYLAASHTGTLCLFGFFALLAAKTGGWDLGPMRERTELAPLFWLALFGFGIKAGLFPLHVWLPSAHANAPSHVSALLSGVAIKMGIYGLVRFSGWLPLPIAAGWTVTIIGAVTALLGIAFAFAQTDVKRLLAYSSVENIGIILIGLGGAFLGFAHGNAAWGRLALAGALLHVWNHGLFKALLFFGAGSVLHATGTREMSRLGGLWRAMPWTAGLFAVGAMAVSALPPLNGFTSEWLIYLGLFDSITSRGTAAWVAMPAAIMLGITGALALATFVKASAMIFLGAPRSAVARHAHDAGGWMRAPMIVLAAACVVIGSAPLLLWPALRRAVATWDPAWNPDTTPTPLAWIGPMQLMVAVALVSGAAALWYVTSRRVVQRNLTWDCGYALPTSRMQYTGGSFSGIGAGWFRWILAPERRLRRPRGFFPMRADISERVPETVLERIIQPFGQVILGLAAIARQLQHGRLQFYIAYVVAGLAGLTALVATGAFR
jgi:hydrogenase-4 component B